MSSSVPSPLTQRLTCLDVFRGLAIAAMILVNNPGSWSYVYPPLLHAEWHGFTPTDLIFPAFLLISGVAIAFSLGKRLNEPLSHLYGRILRRCALLFALGMFLNGLSFWLGLHPNFRLLGVLQRISLAYLCAAIAVLHLRTRSLWGLCGILLIGYWLALIFIPVPHFGAGDLSLEGNLAGYFDRSILGTKFLLKQASFDPEGLFSTIPAIATVLFGYFAGRHLRNHSISSRVSIDFTLWGLSSLVLGYLWHFSFPINKQLWTSSYVLVSTGWSLLLLAACYEVIEVRQFKRWSIPFQIMGLNAIFVFVASGIVARLLYVIPIGPKPNRISAYTWLYQTCFESIAGSLNGSLCFAVFTVLFWLVILWGLYRRGWFFKL
jgi:predicted acyltransferase